MTITAQKTRCGPQKEASAGPAQPGSAMRQGPSGGPPAARPRARRELVEQPVERLEAEVIELSSRLAAGTYELLVLVGELDQRGSWATWGALSCAAWLADLCDIDVSTAHSQVRVARAMRQYPHLDAAMATGDVSYSKARVLVPYLTAGNVADLVAIAERTPGGRLGAAIAAWSQRNDDPNQIRDRQHQARSVSWRSEPDANNPAATPTCSSNTTTSSPTAMTAQLSSPTSSGCADLTTGRDEACHHALPVDAERLHAHPRRQRARRWEQVRSGGPRRPSRDLAACA